MEISEKGIVMKRKLLICTLLFVTFSLFSQNAERLELLLDQERVSYAQAALLVLEASGRIDSANQMGEEEAFNFALKNNLLPKNAVANHAVNMQGLSFLVMRAFEIKGGFFYSITKSQHHAYRELVYRGMIQGRSDPLMYITGEQLFFTVNRVLYSMGVNQ